MYIDLSINTKSPLRPLFGFINGTSKKCILNKVTENLTANCYRIFTFKIRISNNSNSNTTKILTCSWVCFVGKSINMKQSKF